MSATDFNAVVNLLSPLVKRDGPYARLKEAVESVKRVLDGYLPHGHDVTEKLLGHTGLRGEFGNGIGNPIQIHVPISLETQQPEALKDALSQLVLYSVKPSQRAILSEGFERGKKGGYETSSQAHTRIAREINEWLDKNEGSVSAPDAKRIRNGLAQYLSAAAEIDRIVEGGQNWLKALDTPSAN